MSTGLTNWLPESQTETPSGRSKNWSGRLVFQERMSSVKTSRGTLYCPLQVRTLVCTPQQPRLPNFLQLEGRTRRAQPQAQTFLPHQWRDSFRLILTPLPRLSRDCNIGKHSLGLLLSQRKTGKFFRLSFFTPD